MNTRLNLDKITTNRILILDGAMGTMVQTFGLTEEDYRGTRFLNHGTNLKGCNDVLCLTRPEVICSIHEAYLKAGADIIETCSFNATAVSLADYGLSPLAYEISAAAAAIARKAAEKFSTTEKPRFVAGSMGPTNKSGSMSPDMNDPGFRAVSWDELEAAFYDNARGLLDGGADILLIETVFDTLNAKAAIAAVRRLGEERGADIPLMISATVSDAAGRVLSGQTVEAFSVSVLHAKPWSIGLNCSFGAEKLIAPIRELAKIAPCLVSVHPNAGLPNQFGAYDETAETMCSHIEDYMKEGLVNILGGCCGSTPAHIAAIATASKTYKPRTIPKAVHETILAGHEALHINTVAHKGGKFPFVPIGEQTNVAGSKQFLKLIREEKYEEALSIPRKMIEEGSAIINIGMDDPLLDAKAVMIRFLNLALADPVIARVPIMIDSSRWGVIEAALKCIQGKVLVNSISLKEGEEEFLRKAGTARRYGAAVVVMLFDEKGQAADYERKIEIAGRSYALLTGNGFPPEDIVFDPNVLSIVTGMAEHDSYALHFIRACSWIRDNCPFSRISGGISNLSFSFRGNNAVREAMHGVFLKHAVDAGLTMAIVNPGTLLSYDSIEKELRDKVEQVILCKPSPDPKADAGQSPAEQLVSLAVRIKEEGKNTAKKTTETAEADWRSLDAEERVVHAMIRGISDFIETDVLHLRSRYKRSVQIVEGPLMKGMKEVGNRFGQGTMYLPQVIRSAMVMKKAVAALEPFIQNEKTDVNSNTAGSNTTDTKILLATVKGDVHDIGKNIVGVVLGCNGYDIIDLGVMVPPEKIIETAVSEKVAAIGLSGLITPSLDEMVTVAREMEKQGLAIPLLIGGATTSLAHTALRIAPEYSGPVVYVSDAGRSAETVGSLFSDAERPRFLNELDYRYRKAAELHENITARRESLSLEKARENRFSVPFAAPAPVFPEQPAAAFGQAEKAILEFNDYPLSRVIPYIDWPVFLRSWEMQTGATETEKLLTDANILLDKAAAEKLLRLKGVAGFFPAASENEDIIVFEANGVKELARFSFLRNQEKKRPGIANASLADFIAPCGNTPDNTKKAAGWIGLFALSAGFGLKEAENAFRAKNDDYGALLLSTIANSLAEAFSEEVHLRVQKEFWGYNTTAPNSSGGIRPAFGYPACPDHRDKLLAFKLLDAQKRCGLELTGSAMIIPAASVCGMYIAHPASYYFGVGSVGEDQLAEWSKRKGITVEEARKRTGKI